jgi:hypothetical protein
MTFSQALEYGERAESQVAQLFVDAGIMVLRDHSDARHDMVVQLDGRFHVVEVKDESRHADSGNVVVELMQRGKPSGLSVSEASVYIHLLSTDAIVYRVQPMRLWLKAHALDLATYWRSFGDNRNQGYVLPYRLFAEKPWAEKVSLEGLTLSRIWRYVS